VIALTKAIITILTHQRTLTMITTYTNTIAQEIERLQNNPSMANTALLRFLVQQPLNMPLGDAMQKYFSRF
jgi:hypothetical protein